MLNFNRNCVVTGVVVLIHLVLVDSRIKEWLPNINWNNPKMWLNSQMPCDFENIIFEPKLDAVVELPADLKLDTLVLPENGYFVLNLRSNMLISEEPEPTDGSINKCNKPSKDNVYLNPKADKWFLSRNWNNTYFDRLDTNNNPAVPHQELIPCDNDQVVFPSENTILLDFEDAPNVLLNSVRFKNNVQLVKFIQFSTTELGRVMLKNSDTTNVNMRRCFGDRDQCACHQSVEHYDLMGILCRNEREFCEKPLCLDPIKPIGHCCEICGSTVLIKNQRLAKPIRDMIEKMQNNQDKEVYTYVSIVNNGTKEINNPVVQVVAVDRQEYDLKSVKFIDKFTSAFRAVYESETVSVYASGSSYNPGSYNFWNIVIGTFFLILLVYGGLYLYYERSENNPLANWLPTFRLNNYRLFNRPFVFARFENRGNEGEYENITVGMEAAPSVMDLAAPSAFKNPIYDKAMPHYDEPKSMKQHVSYESTSKSTQEEDEVETDLEEINISTIE